MLLLILPVVSVTLPFSNKPITCSWLRFWYIVTLTTESCKNAATTLSRMKLSGYVGLYLVERECSLLLAV